ncbi:MAG TPA: hypothetical protein VGX78_15085 [Pirellulales bacterium]|nr:hypothetical protein [Pirellulales bacterium]
MNITFECPNGHKLNCPEIQAGKPGKCPKCGAVFRVPNPPKAAPEVAVSRSDPFAFLSQEDGEKASDAAQPPAVVAEPVRPLELPDQDDQLQIGEGPAGVDEIVFLCPNGHRLHGPASLVGRPGQCPHCQVRFLIPSPEDVPEEDEVTLEQDPLVSFADILISNDNRAKGALPGVSPRPGTGNPLPPAGAHPLATLLTRLWASKTPDSSIELHLGDGKLIVPDELSTQHPFGNFGVFAVREANGSHTVTAVSWDSIERITVRGLAKLPKEWFNGRS